MPTSRLTLEDVSYFVHLGCTAEEQKHAQQIRVSVCVDFHNLPDACRSDELEGTVCYAEINQVLEKICGSRSFFTIESLGYSCWTAVCELIQERDELEVKIEKLHPPLSKNLKCASFALKGLRGEI